VITAKNGMAIYGNMAQPNHYANYISMGLISLGLLRPQMRWWQQYRWQHPCYFVMVLSGSRSFVAVSGWAWPRWRLFWQQRDKSCRHLLHYTLLLLLGFRPDALGGANSVVERIDGCDHDAASVCRRQ